MKCSIKRRHLPPSPPTATKQVHNNHIYGFGRHTYEYNESAPALDLQIPPTRSNSLAAEKEREMKIILDMAREGKTATEIAEEAGCNRNRVMQVVKQFQEYGAKLKPEPKKKKPAAVKPPKPPKPPKPTTGIWTEENINKLIELHRQGLTYSEIGRELGVTKNSVTSKVQRMINFGILESRMDHILWSEEDIEMLFKLREDGKTWAEIGKFFGKSSNTCQVTFSRLLERRTDNRCRKQSE